MARRALRKVYVRVTRSGHRTLKPSGTGNKRKLKKPYTDTLTAYGSGTDFLRLGGGVALGGLGVGLARAGGSCFGNERKAPIGKRRR